MNTILATTQTRELLSALADGELAGSAIANAIVSCREADALESWSTYHLIGEALRQPLLVVTTSDVDFLDRLNKRFEREQITMPVPVPVPVAIAVSAAGQNSPVVDIDPGTNGHRGPAANDGNFKWKLLAGFASIAVVSAIGWNAPSVSGLSGAPQLAESSNVQPLLVASPLGPVVRDARLEELLLAHRQMGGVSALQAPSGFLRNAAFEAAPNGRR